MAEVENNAKKSTRKLQDLQDIEVSAQKRWSEQRIFEVDAPSESSPDAHQPKYMANFPYPYMNGRLHLGHAFTLSKAEFAVGYHRLKGRRTLLPFGFHCTGMPIKACADKLKTEISKFGNPPVFPDDVDDPTATDKKQHSKVAAKTGGAKYQWEIMRSMGVPENEIALFADERHWLEYFPPIAIKDLSRLGMKIDWRRTFITTDVNPYYDSFIRWQFETLRDLGKINFGKRYTVYSPVDGQACLDHDRSEGEGANPQEYTLIKLQAVEPFPAALQSLQGHGRQVFLVAATLRPETMYGQTNCWVGPDLEYGAYEMKDKQTIYICTHRAARNLAYQEHTAAFGVFHSLLTVRGHDLIGMAVKAPFSVYDIVYVLPMMSVAADKGSGIVTSVPSDSPHDYAALRDLQKKPAFRERFHLKDEQVLPFQPVPILDCGDELGQLCAQTACEKFGVASQNDSEKLEKCKELVYLRSFYDGRMLVGDCAGELVKDAKPRIRQSLIDQGLAVSYYEPERRVKSRSGDDCVVSLIDQWFLDYGEPAWREDTRRCLSQLNCYASETYNQFSKTLDWLNQWACSRSFGLGSRVPWDPQFLIESLSDSTIYMVYYTVVQFLQHGVLDGRSGNPHGIPASACTHRFWDYVLLGNPTVPEGIPVDLLRQMRREVQYWYPFDLRVSGKDLIPNHLTFCLYNHVAIFPEAMWPKGMRANGHLLVNKEKMAKSRGNFKTIHDMIQEYGADATRLALADAGDGLDDANFATSMAESGILRLHTLLEWCKDMLRARASLRQGEYLFADRVFESDMNRLIQLTEGAYEALNFREALKYGFFDLQLAKDRYREVNAGAGMHAALVLRYIEVQALLMAPIVPHVADHLWHDLLGMPQSIVEAAWPKVGIVDEPLLAADKYVQVTSVKFRQLQQQQQGGAAGKKQSVTESKGKPTQGEILVATQYPAWQQRAVVLLKTLYNEKTGAFAEERVIAATLKQEEALQPHMKKVMPFVMMVKEKVMKEGVSAMSLALPFDEREVLTANLDYLCRSLDLVRLDIHVIRDEKEHEALGKKAALAKPGEPVVHFE